MKSPVILTIAIGLCVFIGICPVNSQNDVPGNTEEDDACKYGCPAIVDNTLITSCQDDDGEVSTCTECKDTDTVATLSCKPGYERTPDPGYNQTTCETHGTGSNWSKPVFSCTPKIPEVGENCTSNEECWIYPYSNVTRVCDRICLCGPDFVFMSNYQGVDNCILKTFINSGFENEANIWIILTAFSSTIQLLLK